MQKKSTPSLNNNPAPPALLESVQNWMGQAVSTPSFDKKKAAQIKKISQYITASNTQSKQERLNIYINDYWPRCIESLAEDFPGLVNLMGLETFEAWMERYLTHYPSHHFTLYYLGEDLFDFMQKHYDQANKPLILDCVRYEWAKAHAYFDAEALPFSPENLTDDQKANLAALPLRLQPHVYPLALQYDLSTWAQNNYKKKPKVKQTYVVVYRYDYKLTDQLISRAFYQLIFTLKSELHTLDSALDTVMSHLNTKDHRHLEANLQQWFSLCVQKRWICHPEK